MPYKTIVLSSDMCVHITFIIVIPVGVTDGLILQVICRKFILNKFFVNAFFGDDFNHVAVAITIDNKAIQRINLNPFSTHEHQGVTTDDKMKQCLMHRYPIISSSNGFKDDSFNFCKRQIKF